MIHLFRRPKPRPIDTSAQDRLAEEMTRDLRSYRASEQHRRARQPIIDTMHRMRRELGLPEVRL